MVCDSVSVSQKGVDILAQQPIKWHPSLLCSWSTVFIDWDCLRLGPSHCVWISFTEPGLCTTQGLFLAQTLNEQLAQSHLQNLRWGIDLYLVCTRMWKLESGSYFNQMYYTSLLLVYICYICYICWGSSHFLIIQQATENGIPTLYINNDLNLLYTMPVHDNWWQHSLLSAYYIYVSYRLLQEHKGK